MEDEDLAIQPVDIDDLIARLERSKTQAANGIGRSADDILAEARARLAARGKQTAASTTRKADYTPG